MVLADSVGLALLVVLDTLTPAERLAFVLHDMFDLPFDDIAPIVDRSPAAARQLASREHARFKQTDADVPHHAAVPADLEHQRVRGGERVRAGIGAHVDRHRGQLPAKAPS